MLEYINGNIIEVQTELLINASNGKGWMGGVLGRFILLNGVAESIHYRDHTIERLAKKTVRDMKVKCGDVFHTHSGKLNFPKGILHAVTMLKPGQKSNLSIIETCLDNILKFCKDNNINSVAIPLLGTGTGRVKESKVLKLYNDKLSSSKVIFYVVQL
uniref:Appr-1-p processing domain-containing protein n=1 Tax=Aeromonas sp. Ne-1 TaxID=1675689 RepID=A0A0H4JBX7_9GAMM|nr:appr-1-p processing domain-containing protein [Aeromonas sp. Ne-1]